MKRDPAEKLFTGNFPLKFLFVNLSFQQEEELLQKLGAYYGQIPANEEEEPFRELGAYGPSLVNE